ncbi:hypothetical protein O3M35_006927 [Rhynocoris fuscipes]|uniref:non-specific serine/threonine protein kinase n=1 Tax=Rhynocoris fuscipes TaxID=488301 RepID=A0AAW1DHI2_9HEMI
MAPIKKKPNYRRQTTCRVNVPPILSLRKQDAFDFLLKQHDSNPFLSSSEAETTSCIKSIYSESSPSPPSSYLFLPKSNNSEIDSPLSSSGKSQKKVYSKVQKKKRLNKVSKKKSPELIELENVISDCLRNAPERFSVPLTHHSTPLKPLLAQHSSPFNSKPSTSNTKPPFSPIVHETSVHRTSIDELNAAELELTAEFSKLYCDENQDQPSRIVTSLDENFQGFHSVVGYEVSDLSKTSDISNQTNSEEKMKPLDDSQNDQEVSEWEDKHEQDVNLDTSSTASDKCVMRGSLSESVLLKDNELTKSSDGDNVSCSSNADEEKLGASQNKQEESEWTDKHDQGEYTGSSLDEISDTSDKNIICKYNENEARNNSKNMEAKQEVDEQNMSIVEEKELINEVIITESPCSEQENVIISESLADDDDDKSEDVSSALSSDQEAREGISSSDLESNSIDEEKEFGTLELRRHSFEKLRRLRRLAMVSQANESYLPSRDHELSNNFHSNKHFTSCDNINDQSPKHSLLFSDSVGDSSDEERISGRSPASSPTVSVFSLYESSVPLDPLPENLEEDSIEIVTNQLKNRRTSEPSSGRRRSNRLTKDVSPSRQSPLSRSSVTPDLNMVIEESDNEEGSVLGDISEIDHFILPANKKYRRSLSIIRQLSKDEPSANISTGVDLHKGRGYDQFVEHIIHLQAKGDSSKVTPTRAYRKSLSIRRCSLLGQRTPPRGRRASTRISSIPTSPISYRQLPIKRPSLSASLLCSSNRTQDISITPSFRLTLQPNQTLQQNITRCSNILSSKDSCLNEATGMTSGIEGLESEDYKDHVLILCKQKEPTSFHDILDHSALEEAIKVGEGVYGEVFMITRPTRKNVLKIIPIEGDFLVNGEKQKRYEEIYTELIIAKWLDRLRYNDTEYMTNCFAELVDTWVIKGKYPGRLLELWNDYDERKGSDNDRPDIFNDDQLYLVLELGNAGTDLENYSFSTAKQALSIFKQTVFAIAVAEACFEFEHRDLHWGNVLVSRTAERCISFRLNGKEYKVITNGVKSTIIDYTLSRITLNNNVPVYNDIGLDPDMFIATGDYQFDIYRHMKKDVCDRWDQFVPKTNVRWLHYLIDKMLKKVKYQRKTAKVHRDSIRTLQDIESWILNCDTSVDVAIKIADSN